MYRKMTEILIVSLLFISFFTTKTAAQEMITPEKRALIEKLLKVTEPKQMIENFTNAMLLQMEKKYPQIMSQMVSKAGILKDKKQEELQKKILESRLHFSQRFKELYPQRVNLAQVVEEIYYPLYDIYFTVDELKDLIIFYKSPIGEKWVKVEPQLIQESIQKFSELLNPKIIQLINEIIKEEKERLLEMQESTQEEKQ